MQHFISSKHRESMSDVKAGISSTSKYLVFRKVFIMGKYK